MQKFSFYIGPHYRIIHFGIMAALFIFSAYLLYLTYSPDHLPESRSDCEEYGRMLDVRGFELVNKAIHPNSSEIIEITTCWMTNTPILQVGKLITFNASVSSLRYVENVTNYEKIVIEFPHDSINYWYDDKDMMQNNFPQSNHLVLYSDDSKIFRSENPINIRFSVPENIFFKYCEHTTSINCFEIQNIIQPASYDMALQIETNNTLIKLNELLLNYTISLLVITVISTFVIINKPKVTSMGKLQITNIILFAFTYSVYFNYVIFQIYDDPLTSILFY